MSGFYLIYRNWMDHPVFQDKVLCRSAAWIWMIEAAAFKPTQHMIDNTVIVIERGQFAVTLRELADAWGWSTTKVRSFLDVLRKEKMITLEKGTKKKTSKSIITLCNYERFQTPFEDKNTTEKTQKTHKKHTENTIKKEGKEGKEGNGDLSPPAVRPWVAAIKTFDAVLVEVFGEARRRPHPPASDSTYAKQFFDAGADADMLRAIYLEAQTKKCAAGEEPITHLSYFKNTVARTLKTQAQELDVNGATPYPPRRPPPGDTTAARRAIFEAGSDRMEAGGRDTGGR